ncbi:MAG TPA: carbamate kinase [Candidatus Krumholzibacteria bacterium]|nr:carbamate kinase [Candidatus Krumholzibacteria bacterium]HPD71256.1 carbamate kinase [Candidatus Krumholzibacteria bacterium]HRY39044.1 carbamate kinase [Candidatus Krumholzibacteria bacterium]
MRADGVARRRFVIALGGNAILPVGKRGTFAEQVAVTQQTMDQVARLAAAGHEVVMSHGNGPVVGNIVLRGDAGEQLHGIPAMPMFVCGADSQGGLGFLIQQSLQNSLRKAGIDRPVATVVTQVRVDSADPAFARPTKPIGPFYDERQARLLEVENGWTVVQDAGRGWRRVVPSPKPLEVVEWPAIRALLEAGVLVIAVGGGGIPVVREADGQLRGVDAVIDKDRASDLLGRLVEADTLMIVTQIDKVFVRYGKPDAEALDVLPASRARALLAAGEFPAGSMGPKIESALGFLAHGGREVIITEPGSLLAAVSGTAGTRIVPDPA